MFAKTDERLNIFFFFKTEPKENSALKGDYESSSWWTRIPKLSHRSDGAEASAGGMVRYTRPHACDTRDSLKSPGGTWQRVQGGKFGSPNSASGSDGAEASVGGTQDPTCLRHLWLSRRKSPRRLIAACAKKHSRDYSHATRSERACARQSANPAVNPAA